MRIILALTVRKFDFAPTKEIWRILKLAVTVSVMRLIVECSF